MTLKNTLPSKRQTITQAEPPITLPALLDEKAAAKHLGVSVSYLRNARREGAPGGRTAGPDFIRLESFGTKGGKNGGRIMYPRTDLDAWLMSFERQRVI